MKLTKVKHPKMVDSSMSRRLRSQEDELMDSMPPSSPKDQPASFMNEEDADKSGPSLPPKRKNHELNMMAKGGEVDKAMEVVPDKGFGKIIRVGMAEGGMINGEVSMKDAEEDRVEHPKGLESSNSSKRPSMKEYMSDRMPAFARGGEVSPDSEIEEEHHASIAAAIMAKKQRQMELDSDSDEDQMVKMAFGGEVDIIENGAEQPNQYYGRDKAILKENYDEDFMSVSQPMDSNEMGDEREDSRSDRNDKVSAIRNRMIKRRVSK